VCSQHLAGVLVLVSKKTLESSEDYICDSNVYIGHFDGSLCQPNISQMGD
jgi:hypothetical protein